jgi:hypothetical protein
MTNEDGGAFRNCAPCKGSGRILAARSPQGEDHESHLGSALAGTWPVPRPYTVNGVPQGEDHGPEPDALGGLPPSQPKEDQ